MRFFLCLLCLSLASPVLADPISVKEEKPPVQEEKKEDTKAREKAKLEMHERLRMEALLEEASNYGFQTGFSDRYRKIQAECEKRSHEFDEMYPFEQVLLQNGTVRPPVITKAEDSTTIQDARRMVRTGQAYHILRSAEFVSVPPSWRTYILIDEAALTPQEPAKQLTPKNAKERKFWEDAYHKAYDEGIETAEQYFEEEMNRLNREFSGMIQYHVLNRQGKISLPGISRGHYDVRISDDTMELDQRTFMITDAPHFQEKKQWRSHE